MALWMDALRYDAYRRLLRNPGSQRRFAAAAPALSPIQQSVVRRLADKGVASVPFHDLVDDEALWHRLRRGVDDFVQGPEVQQATAAWQKDARVGTQKGYLVRLVPRQAVVTSNDLWLRLALHPRILDVVNSYYGLFARLFSFDVWYTIADQAERTRRGSQKWHRDPEDRNVLKVFLYFSDVTDGSGPLEYVTNSRLGERNCHTTYAGVAWRHAEAEFAQVPEADIVRCTGASGTLVFCDTAGIHRGGYAVDAARILATWGYTTPASLHPRRFTITDLAAVQDRPAVFAVTGP